MTRRIDEARPGAELKVRYCFNCGEELGPLARSEWQPGDTCGKIECERATRHAIQDERDEARLDREIDERHQEIVGRDRR